MEWSSLLAPFVIPQILAVLGMWMLAGILLRLDFNNTANRVFSMLLALRGLSMIGALLRDIQSLSIEFYDPGAGAYWAAVFPYTLIPLPFLVLIFASVYPRKRGLFATPIGMAAVGLVALALEVAYFLDHSLFVVPQTVSITLDGETVLRTLHSSTGPLAILLGVFWLLLGLLTFLFASDYVRMRPGPRKNALLIVMLGFALNTIYESTAVIFANLAGVNPPTLAASQVMTQAAIVPIIAAVALLVAHHNKPDTDPEVRTHLQRSFWVLPLPAVMFLAFTGLTYFPDNAVAAFLTAPAVLPAITGFWRLSLPVLVSYALLKFQLFDIDLKVKFAVKQSTLVGWFLFVFFTTTEVLESFLTSGLTSNGLSIGVAVGLTYVLTPVQRMAERIADKTMPNTQNTPDFRDRKRLEVYRATLEGALEDGEMTDRELRILEHLKMQLGLTDMETQNVETLVRKDLGLSAAS